MAKVLVADDDPVTRHFLQQALEFGGHEVTAVGDGLEAMAELDRPGGTDILVTDYAMPRVNGVEVIGHAHRVDPTIASIVITAYRDLDLAMQAMQAGAVAYLPKPFRAEHLLTVVRGALERREIAAEAMRLRLLAPMLERFTMVLASTIESKDTATQQHANRLVHLAGAVSQQLGLDPELASAVRYGACLHDVGKLAVPDHLLSKPGPLTEEEMAIMRQHPVMGSHILSEIDTWDDVRLVVRHHHERWDGRGYPDGLRRAMIPLGARLVSVVDAFDVMRSGRPYSPARSQDQILSELHRERGRQFDPEMVDALLAVVREDDFHVDPAVAWDDEASFTAPGVPQIRTLRPAG